MSVYYNEWDRDAAAWLRELIKAGLIPAGDVDERSITEVKAHELTKYRQCHFFAGVSGWCYALQLAGWPEDEPVGTGSVPCQPFSAAGKQLGTADERHLWPAFIELIKQCRTAGQAWTRTILGEQVASAETLGTELEAAFVDAVRERRIADANRIAHKLATSRSLHYHRRWVDGVRADLEAAGYSLWLEVLGAHSAGAPQMRQRIFWMADADGWDSSAEGIQRGGEHGQQPKDGSAGGLGDTDFAGSQGRLERGDGADQRASGQAGMAGTWDAFEVILCTDGNARRVGTGVQPLAHGISSRVGLLRGYGNAIVPQTAARFILAHRSLRDRDDGVGVSATGFVETMEFEP